MTYSLGRDIASEIGAIAATPRATGVAGGAGDATLVTGPAIDVTQLASPSGANVPCRYESVCFLLATTCTMAAGNTYTVTASIETAPTSAFATTSILKATATVLVLNAAAGGGQVTAVAKVGCSLENCSQWIRLKWTGDLSAATVDTSDTAALAIFGRPAELP